MALTRLFRNGKSQAVRITAEPVGDELRIRPAGRPTRGALQALASFAPGFMAEGRGDQEQGDREGVPPVSARHQPQP